MILAFFKKPLGWLISGVVIVLLVWFLWSQFMGSRQRAAQGRQDMRSAEALAETAKVAADTVVSQADEEATVDELVAATTKEIENAPTDEVAGAAARRAICSLPDYRDSASCRQ